MKVITKCFFYSLFGIIQRSSCGQNVMFFKTHRPEYHATFQTQVFLPQSRNRRAGKVDICVMVILRLSDYIGSGWKLVRDTSRCSVVIEDGCALPSKNRELRRHSADAIHIVTTFVQPTIKIFSIFPLKTEDQKRIRNKLRRQ